MPREPLVGVDRAHIGDDLREGVHVLPVRADMPMHILYTVHHASHAEEVPHTLPVIAAPFDPHHGNTRTVFVEVAHVDLLLRRHAPHCKARPSTVQAHSKKDHRKISRRWDSCSNRVRPIYSIFKTSKELQKNSKGLLRAWDSYIKKRRCCHATKQKIWDSSRHSLCRWLLAFPTR